MDDFPDHPERFHGNRPLEPGSRINHNLEQTAQAIFKSWFVDFEPFKDGKFVDSELGRIPEGWRVGILGKLGLLLVVRLHQN
jgi:type I restriction enzyme S subunit